MYRAWRGRRRQIFAIGLTLTALALSVGASLGMTAPAAGVVLPANSCVSGYGSVFDGYLSSAPDPSVGTYEGAMAVIGDRWTSICTTGSQDNNANFSYVWVMIHQNNAAPGGADNGYAQSGLYQGVLDSCPHFTTESDRDNTTTFYRDIHYSLGCVGPTGQNNYWVQYTNGVIRMNVDVTILDITPWNPYAFWDYSQHGPFQTEFNAETKYIGTDVPSTYFIDMRVQRFDDSWGSPGDIPPMYDSCPWPTRYTKTSISQGGTFSLQTSGSSSGYNCQ